MLKDEVSESKEQSKEMLEALEKLNDKEVQKALDVVTGMTLVSELYKKSNNENV